MRGGVDEIGDIKGIVTERTRVTAADIRNGRKIYVDADTFQNFGVVTCPIISFREIARESDFFLRRGSLQKIFAASNSAAFFVD